jgi:hypothetical protein
MKQLLTPYQIALAKSVLETDFQAFETLFDQLLHNPAERYSQLGNYPFLRNLPGYAEFKNLPDSQPHVDDLDYHKDKADYSERYARNQYFAEVLKAFAIEKQKLMLLDEKFSESQLMQCVDQKLRLHNAPPADWKALTHFQQSEAFRQIAGEARRMHSLRIIDETLQNHGFRVMVWEHWPLNRVDLDKEEDINWLFIGTDAEVAQLVEYEDTSLITGDEEYSFVIDTFDDLRLHTPATPLSEEDKKRLGQARRTAYTPIVIFLPICLGCAYLVYVNFTDPGFRSPDSYVVGFFLLFMSLASLGMVLAYRDIISRLNRVLKANEKHIFSGKLIKITEGGTTRRPTWEWTIEHETEYKSIPIRLLNKSAMEGFQSSHDIKAGDWVEVHQASDEPVTLTARKLKM